MKKINLSVILDSIFLTFCAFIVTFTLLFTTLSRGLSFFLATVISLNLGLITFYLLFKKSKENYLTNTEKDYANDIINQLCFNGEKTNTYLIEKAFCNLKIKYKKKSKRLPSYKRRIFAIPKNFFRQSF